MGRRRIITLGVPRDQKVPTGGTAAQPDRPGRSRLDLGAGARAVAGATEGDGCAIASVASRLPATIEVRIVFMFMFLHSK